MRKKKLKTAIVELCEDGLHTDGAHHKQWFLEAILLVIGGDIPRDAERGIAP